MRYRKYITFLAVLAILPAQTAALTAADSKLIDRVKRATEVYEEIYEQGLPKSLLRKAFCVAVIPHVVKGAFIFGGKAGSGLVSCRSQANKWSPPAFLSLKGGSFGLQVGAEAADVVLFIMSKNSVRSLLKSEFTLGGSVSVAAGPVGRSVEGSTDARFDAEVYSYARSKGLFVGISLEGARVYPNDDDIEDYYGKEIPPSTIIFDHQVPHLPIEARKFIEALPK